VFVLVKTGDPVHCELAYKAKATVPEPDWLNLAVSDSPVAPAGIAIDAPCVEPHFWVVVTVGPMVRVSEPHGLVVGWGWLPSLYAAVQ
jgi:hypothetical protein